MVFKFKIYFSDENGIYEVQERFVLAESEEEAIEVLTEHRDKLVECGCMYFDFDPNPIVELDYVIYNKEK